MRSLDSGLWIQTKDGKYFEVKANKISSAKLVPDIPTRYGIADGKNIKLLEKTTFPIFRENVTEVVKQKFAEANFKAEQLFPNDPIAETRLTTLIAAVCQTAMTVPAKYRWGYVDSKLMEHEEYTAYKVVGYNEATGREILEAAEYLTQTHLIPEAVDGNPQVMPRTYWDIWLPDSQYELAPYDDVARFGLYEFAKKLDNYPMPDPETGQTVNQEAMLYMQGYIAKTGEDAKPYYALLRPVWLNGEDGEEKFIFEMKLSRTVTKFQKAVPVPKPDEVPVTITAPAKSLNMVNIAEMLAQAAVVK